VIIVYAFNIHLGGGKVLLEALLSALKNPAVLFSDARLKLKAPLGKNIHNIAVAPSALGRFKCEFQLRKQARFAHRVLCFGNLPPLFSLPVRTDLFFQNTILLRKNAHHSFPWIVRVKHHIERVWLRWGIRHINTVYVQSAVVRNEFLAEFPNAKAVVAPFFETLPAIQNSLPPEFDFIYVASGDSHKNHRRLLGAWSLLAEAGVFPTLVLTLSPEYHELLELVASLQKRGALISNYSNKSHEEILALYTRCRSLIFPSLTESFGLPLIEARAAGISIVASELDYVREFVSPVQSFDPFSEKSIFRAVLRFLGKESLEPRQEVWTAEEFLKLMES
jgi:glycosyltransferase involved in cell wall biosynthesis